MQYVLMFYETPDDAASRSDGRAEKYWAGWSAYIAALQQSGLVRGGEGLQPPASATTVKVRGGKRSVQDGPFADTKEQLGGFFVLEASLDVALEWASRAPCAATGGVEVRPTLPPPSA